MGRAEWKYKSPLGIEVVISVSKIGGESRRGSDGGNGSDEEFIAIAIESKAEEPVKIEAGVPESFLRGSARAYRRSEV